MVAVSSCSSVTCWWQCQEHVPLSPAPSPSSACSALVVAWLCQAWDSTPSHSVSYLFLDGAKAKYKRSHWIIACGWHLSQYIEVLIILTSVKHVFFCDYFFSSCGVDPHSCPDCGGDSHRLLLHDRPVDPGFNSLLHSGLEVVNPGCIFALLCLLPHRMVSYVQREHGVAPKQWITKQISHTGGSMNLQDG